MYSNSILAVTGALVAVVAAVPRAEFQHQHHPHQHHAKRDLVTEWETVWETIPVTKTVWVTPSQVQSTASISVQAAADTPASSAISKVAAAYVAPVQSEAAAAAVAPSSSYVAPAYVAPTTAAYVAPAPASTYVAPQASAASAPQASSAAAPAPAASSYTPSSGSGSGSGSPGSAGESFVGDLTNYEVGLGACGITNTEDQKVVAISHVLFDAVSTGNPNTNPLCGKMVYITGVDGSVYPAKIVDRCPGCDEGSLDLPLPYFNTITNNGNGRVHNIHWTLE